MAPPRLIPGFLLEDERAQLEAFYRDALSAGRLIRHKSREYSVIKCGLFLPALCQRTAALLGHNAVTHRLHTLMLAYAEGDHAPLHVDSPGRVRRLNALVVPARAGGELKVIGRPFELAPGDALVFEPSVHRHELSPVTGERVIWSLGLVPRLTR